MHTPNWEPGPQPWPGMAQVTFGSKADAQPTDPPSQGRAHLFGPSSLISKMRRQYWSRLLIRSVTMYAHVLFSGDRGHRQTRSFYDDYSEGSLFYITKVVSWLTPF